MDIDERLSKLDLQGKPFRLFGFKRVKIQDGQIVHFLRKR